MLRWNCFQCSSNLSTHSSFFPCHRFFYVRLVHAKPNQHDFLAQFRSLFAKDDVGGAIKFYENSFNPSRDSFLIDFCGNRRSEARETLLMLMRCYSSVGDIQKVREVYVVGLRDLRPPQVDSDASTGLEALDSVSIIYEPQRKQKGLLNADFFNAYLEVLTRRKNFDKEEVNFVLREMHLSSVPLNALSYHYLIELEVRADHSPVVLWREMTRTKNLRPLPCTVQTLLLRVVPSASKSLNSTQSLLMDPEFVIEVVKEGLKCANDESCPVLDKQMMLELIEQWLSDSSRTFPPDYIMWLMLELEVRCVLDKSAFIHFVQKKHFAELLLLCYKAIDSLTITRTLALMDRHAVVKGSDILALVVCGWSQSGEIEKALDVVELMSRKGYLDLTSPFHKFTVDCIRYTLERHFLMVLADAIGTRELWERAFRHLVGRRHKGLAVTFHSLDILVLAAGKLGEENCALQLVSAYQSEWGIAPRTNTYNCLLVGCSANGGSSFYSTVYDAMNTAGIAANSLTFRILIRQSVLNDNIDEAIYFLRQVTTHPGLRVEVEMILPILERAARVGDVETVNHMSKYALDCDVGIDAAVIQNAIKLLTEAGQNADILQGHLPLHESLRARSKVGRSRVRHEMVL